MHYLFRDASPRGAQSRRVCYTFRMTQLLEQAIDLLNQFPEDVQDRVARTLISQLDEQAEPRNPD